MTIGLVSMPTIRRIANPRYFLLQPLEPTFSDDL